MESLLKDQVALVTGGTAGIGKAIAKRFLEAGAAVTIVGRNPTRGEEALEELSQVSSKCDFIQADVSSPEEADRVVKKVLEKEGKLDVLVNNAGVTRDNLLLKMSPEDWDAVLDINVKSCYGLCKASTKPMMRARRGKVINMSSVVGLNGNPGQTNYAASKAAIIGFTKAMAKELASRNIQVNCIAPGFIETQMTGQLSDQQKEAILKEIPMGRIGDPEEVANVALFLASHLSDYVTAQVVTVDGGYI